MPKKHAKYKAGTHTRAPEILWIEIRGLYESGNYSQRDLVAYAKKRGFKISQPAVSSRAVRESWVKGAVRDEIRQEIETEIKERMGQEILSMLDRHVKTAQAMQNEALLQIDKIRQRRVDEDDPKLFLPPNTVATITNTLAKTQEMEARAKGWDYSKGKPYTGDTDNVQDKPTELSLQIMDDNDVAKMRQEQEEQAKIDGFYGEDGT